LRKGRVALPLRGLGYANACQLGIMCAKMKITRKSKSKQIKTNKLKTYQNKQVKLIKDKQEKEKTNKRNEHN
jgi:hypothetical protein